MKRLSMPRWPAFALPLLGAACVGNEPPDPAIAVTQRVALRAFESCAALEQYIEDTAVQAMEARFDPNQFVGIVDDVGVAEAGDSAAPPARSSGAADRSSAAPTDYSTTNNQVAGVDEADFMKNTGTHIFTLSGQTLHAVQSWPPEDMAHLDRLEIEGQPSAMFLHEDRLVVFSYVYPAAIESGDTERDVIGGSSLPCFRDWYCGYEPATKVSVVDATDPSDLKLSQEIYLPGSYADARLVGDSVRLVLRDYLRQPENLQYWPENYQGNPIQDPEGWRNATAPIRATNERLIRARSLDDWFRTGRYRTESGALADLGYDCRDFHASNGSVELGLATIATLNLGTTVAMQRTSIMGQIGEVYASAESLYIAHPHWWWRQSPGQTNHTYLHKFDIRSPDNADYVASGVVAGHILNQFSMDEHRGYLRVAVTERTWRQPDPEAEPWGELETTNRVVVLGEAESPLGGALQVVGQTEALAEGETIQSARFIEDRGFVVTFEQVDPLFTLDLRDPTAPKVIGELKVPGFSTYIHPLDENHLLTLGVHVPDPTENGGNIDWRERRMKLSMFDVSDFANPREKFTETIGTAYGWTEAAHEHKAFNYFAPRKLLAIPFSDYRQELEGEAYWESFVSDLRLYDIDVNTGISVRGAVHMHDLFRQADGEAYWNGGAWVRRSVLADDYAYAVSDAGIRVVHIEQPGQAIATVVFSGTPK